MAVMVRSVVNPRSTAISLIKLAVSKPVIRTRARLTATSTPTRTRRARRLARDSLASRDSVCRTSLGAVRETMKAGAAPASKVAATARQNRTSRSGPVQMQRAAKIEGCGKVLLQRGHDACGYKNTEAASRGGQQRGFAQRHAHQLRTCCAERGGHGHLLLLPNGSRQQKVRHVDASDEQQAGDSHQENDRAAFGLFRPVVPGRV